MIWRPIMTTWNSWSLYQQLRWDDGLTVYVNQIDPPLEQPVALAFVRDDHLRVTNPVAEDAYITRLIRVTTSMGERMTRRAWMPQTRELVLSAFPWGAIEVPFPPLIEVVSIEAGGVTVDPSAYQVSAPTGQTCPKGRILPASGGSWPTVDPTVDLDAVRVTFRCGYVDGGSPEQAAVPDDLIHAQLLLIGEMYKQRSESVTSFGSNGSAAIVRARDIFMQYRAY